MVSRTARFGIKRIHLGCCCLSLKHVCKFQERCHYPGNLAQNAAPIQPLQYPKNLVNLRNPDPGSNTNQYLGNPEAATTPSRPGSPRATPKPIFGRDPIALYRSLVNPSFLHPIAANFDRSCAVYFPETSKPAH